MAENVTLRLQIANVGIFDGERKLPGTYDVVIAGEIIESVEPYDPTAIRDANMQSINASGKTLLPGLIDAHVHVFNALDTVKQCVPAGVTTVMDMHNERDYATFMKEQCRTSYELPDLLSAFLAATVRDGWSRPIMKRSHATPEVLARIEKWPALHSHESVIDYIETSKSLGADFIKLFQESGECLNFGEIPVPSETLQKLIIDTAHSNNLKCVAHATNLRETMLVLREGVDGLAHQFFDQPHTDELVNLYKSTGAYLIPTLVAVNSFIGTESSTTFSTDKRVNETLNEQSRRCLCNGMRTALSHCNVQWAYETVAALKNANVDIVCGTDSGPGFPGTSMGVSTHHELWMYVEKCGFTVEEALRTATSTCAKRYGLLDRGRIATGRRADLVLVQGDPLEDIRRTLDIRGVWRQGHLHSKYQ